MVSLITVGLNCCRETNHFTFFGCCKKDTMDVMEFETDGKKKKKNKNTIFIKEDKDLILLNTDKARDRDVLIPIDKISDIGFIMLDIYYNIIYCFGKYINYFKLDKIPQGSNILDFWEENDFKEMKMLVEKIKEDSNQYQMKMKILSINQQIRIYGTFTENKKKKINSIILVIDEEIIDEEDIEKSII